MTRSILLCSLALVGLTSLACTSATGLLRPSQGGDEHTAILVETFADGQEGWWTDLRNGGDCEVMDGKLRISVPDQKGTSVTGHPQLDYLSPPYVLEVVIRHTGGSGADYLAIGFRFSDNENVSTLHVNGNGQVALGVMQAGEYLELIPWTRSYQSLEGSTRLQLVDQGDRISVSLGDEAVLSIPFEYLKPGGVYFFVGAYDAVGSTWEVDDVSAWDPPG